MLSERQRQGGGRAALSRAGQEQQRRHSTGMPSCASSRRPASAFSGSTWKGSASGGASCRRYPRYGRTAGSSRHPTTPCRSTRHRCSPASCASCAAHPDRELVRPAGAGRGRAAGRGEKPQHSCNAKRTETSCTQPQAQPTSAATSQPGKQHLPSPAQRTGEDEQVVGRGLAEAVLRGKLVGRQRQRAGHLVHCGAAWAGERGGAGQGGLCLLLQLMPTAQAAADGTSGTSGRHAHRGCAASP